MDLHRRAAGVSEDIGNTLALESLDEDIGAFPRLIGSESGDENLRGDDGSFDGSGRGGGGGGLGGRVGKRAGTDAKRAGESGIVRKRRK